jgi:hypothetical protein
MAPPLRDNAEHWRARAAEARATADQLDDAVARRTMLRIAASYDKLAQKAEERTGPKPRKPS